MTPIVGRAKRFLRSALDRAVRWLVRPMSSELEAKHAEFAALTAKLSTALEALDARLTTDQLAISRDIVRLRPHILTIDALKLKLDEVAIENRRIVVQLESELSEAGAQRSFLLRELNRLTSDLERHQRKCDRSSESIP